MAADMPSGYRSGDRFIELRAIPGVAAVRWNPDRRREQRVRRSEALIGSKPLVSFDHLGVELITVVPDRFQELAVDDDVEFASPVYRLREDLSQVVFHTLRVAAHYDPDPGADEVERRARRLRAGVLGVGSPGPGSYLLEAAATDGPYGTLSLALRMVDEEGAAWASPDIVHEVGPRATALAERESREGMAAHTLDLWHLDLAKVRDAWRNHGFQGHGVTIAVIDDGVDVDHIEFNSIGKVVGQRDFEENSTDARPKTPEDTHGTSCAGVAVARGARLSGSAPAASLLAVRLNFAMSAIDEAIMFLWAGGRADVISCSWGPDQPYFPPDVVVQALREVSTDKRDKKGVPIFFAAGNEAEDMSTDGYAASPYTIAVAASTDSDTIAPYSDFGTEVDLCAPSSGGIKDITTTDRSGTAGEDPGDYRTDFGGTSSATPLVAGAAALILDANPDLAAAEVRDILRSTAEKIGDPSFYDVNGHSVDFGCGRLDADAAVAEALGRVRGTGTDSGRRLSISPVGGQASAAGPPPVFDIDLAGNGVYAVEVATDPALFDEPGNGGRRNADNFFSSYQADGLLTRTPYRLPEAVWRRLSKGQRLHYRAMSGRSANDLSNFQITTPDDSAAGAPFITVTGGPSGRGGNPVVREAVYPSGARFAVVGEDTAGEDYADPTGGGVVPLIDTTGRLDEKLSPNFTLGEFVGNAADQFRYARVSVELVNTLQAMRERVGAAVTLASSYRPPTYNASVEGANRSQHMAGRAADLKVSGLTPLQAAELALEVAGGDIGIGLGPTTVHVDLRGEPASWVYEGAVMGEAEFDQWVAARRRRDARRSRREVTDRRAPSVLAPTRAAADTPPAFVIRPGANRWVAIDVVTDPVLFAPTRDGRTSENSYGSWEEGLVEAVGPEVVIRLPEYCWSYLAKADRVYYRALAASADSNDWPDIAYSLPDSERADAPVIAITPERGPQRRRLVVPLE
ncbi:S8 family serine peptidase [Streptomyces flaveus]|uniref:Subtilase family protein n=1 Tax=Streptomyces flaveus TaxID=66370 RepID=A0A917VPD5_9ACTN|nr:S8 family serine peptidase [Streptomyces flaveus]GGL05532.1 hypothetical protein GCM10010094_77880 [Streptomyces flaveus]